MRNLIYKQSLDTFYEFVFHSMYENFLAVLTVSGLESEELKKCGCWCSGLCYPGV